MATISKRPRLTSAQFLNAHHQTLESIRVLYAAIESMPILAASDPTTMKHFFDDLANVRATVAKLAPHIRRQVCNEEKISNSF
jgi:hypothetical protein